MKRLFEFLGKLAFPKPSITFTEPVPQAEPVVFVANHEKNYGPGVMQLYFPRRFRPWIIYHMLEPGECKAYVQETFFEERLGWPAWLSAFTAKAIEPLLIRLMNATHPVPVYREDPRRITRTFQDSLDALRSGENLLIFPENENAPFYSPEIQEFFPGFLYLAKLYRRETGKSLVFCPVSINPDRETVTVGKSIRFSPNGNYPAEAERVRQHLMHQVAGLYHRPELAPARFPVRSHAKI
jgi:1-acyl-sn-glycerol-3-phosphate acyltransferase